MRFVASQLQQCYQKNIQFYLQFQNFFIFLKTVVRYNHKIHRQYNARISGVGVQKMDRRFFKMDARFSKMLLKKVKQDFRKNFLCFWLKKNLNTRMHARCYSCKLDFHREYDEHFQNV